MKAIKEQAHLLYQVMKELYDLFNDDGGCVKGGLQGYLKDKGVKYAPYVARELYNDDLVTREKDPEGNKNASLFFWSGGNLKGIAWWEEWIEVVLKNKNAEKQKPKKNPEKTHIKMHINEIGPEEEIRLLMNKNKTLKAENTQLKIRYDEMLSKNVDLMMEMDAEPQSKSDELKRKFIAELKAIEDYNISSFIDERDSILEQVKRLDDQIASSQSVIHYLNEQLKDLEE